MEQELAALTERLAALESSSGMSGTINSEIFYWWCTALMIAIHAGFLAYEMGASRVKNVLASGIKNILAFAFMVPTFYFFGWYIYLAFYNGLIPAADGAAGLPWDMSMGPNLADNATGIFWAAFTLFAATTASIFSGAVIERIQTAGFLILAILLGSVVWILGGAWGCTCGWPHLSQRGRAVGRFLRERPAAQMAPPARKVVFTLDEHPPPIELRVKPLHGQHGGGAWPVGGEVSGAVRSGRSHVALVQLGEDLEVGRERRPVSDAATLLRGGGGGAQAAVPRGGGRLERRGLLEKEDKHVGLLEQRAPSAEG